MAPKSPRPGKAEFSIDEFFAEIEKAEDLVASKPLYAERMKNKVRMDREALADIDDSLIRSFCTRSDAELRAIEKQQDEAAYEANTSHEAF